MQKEIQEKTKESEKKQSFISDAFDYLEIFVITAVVALLLFTSVFRVCNVNGRSMENTLQHGQMLLISDLFYEPKAEDIIVFHQTGDNAGDLNEPLVKRVIATEGQWIYIEYRDDLSMRVYVSDDEDITEDDLLDEPYLYL